MENKNFLKHKKFFAERNIDIENPALLYLVSQGLIRLTPRQLLVFNDIIEGLSLKDIAIKHNISRGRVQCVRLYIRGRFPWSIERLRRLVKIPHYANRVDRNN